MRLTKPIKRMPLRELLTHAAKCTRELIEDVRMDLLPELAHFRDLNRPLRRRSRYPTFLALQNALKELEASHAEVMKLSDYVLAQLRLIHTQVRRQDDDVLSA